MGIESFWALVVEGEEQLGAPASIPDCCVVLGEFGTISKFLSPNSPANLPHIS